MEYKSYGKINLSLDILNKREDGYHNINTIMQKISIYDEMSISKSNKFILSSNNKNLESKDNLIYKAYKLMCDEFSRDFPVDIYLKKNLPIASGLAGGTSNGATTLIAINEIYNLGLSSEKLAKMSVKLGADFPFMVMNGTYLCSGIGDKLESINSYSYPILIVNNGIEISSKMVYENYKIDKNRVDFDYIIKNLKNLDMIEDRLVNKMEDVVFKIHVQLKYIKDELKSFNGVPLMSGSGASIFAIFRTEEELKNCYKNIKDKYKYVLYGRTLV